MTKFIILYSYHVCASRKKAEEFANWLTLYKDKLNRKFVVIETWTCTPFVFSNSCLKCFWREILREAILNFFAKIVVRGNAVQMFAKFFRQKSWYI